MLVSGERACTEAVGLSGECAGERSRNLARGGLASGWVERGVLQADVRVAVPRVRIMI